MAKMGENGGASDYVWVREDDGGEFMLRKHQHQHAMRFRRAKTGKDNTHPVPASLLSCVSLCVLVRGKFSRTDVATGTAGGNRDSLFLSFMCQVGLAQFFGARRFIYRFIVLLFRV